MRKVEAEELARVATAPSSEVRAAVAGTWENADLGRVVVTGDVLDVGEWKSRFSEKVEQDGAKKLVLLDPPWLGFELEIAGSTLVLSQGQERYVFARAR